MGAVAKVERELAELWRCESSADEAVLRACAYNLVVVCSPGSPEAAEVSRIVARVSETAPGRTLVVVPAASGGLRTYVSAHCHRGPGGKQICSEQVTLETGAEDLALLPGSILQLLAEEMPVYTWWWRPMLEGDELLAPLQQLSDCLIVDSACFDRPRERLAELHRVVTRRGFKGHVTDLVWARLDPWRDAVAAFFDLPQMRGYLDGIEHVRVIGGGPGERGFTAAGAYLAGWLASRLGWQATERADRWRTPSGPEVRVELEQEPDLPAGEIASVRIEAALADQPVAFAVRRTGPQSELVAATIESCDSSPMARRIKLPERDTAALLCDALQEPVRDRLYAAALDAAARMA